MHDNAQEEPREHRIDELFVKTASLSGRTLPAHLGTTVVSGRLMNAYVDGTLLPVIAGGAIDVTMDLPTLLTVPDFARECGIARSTAWEIVRRGEIETIVIGERSRRIPRDAFIQYINTLRNAEKAS